MIKMGHRAAYQPRDEWRRCTACAWNPHASRALHERDRRPHARHDEEQLCGLRLLYKLMSSSTRLSLHSRVSSSRTFRDRIAMLAAAWRAQLGVHYAGAISDSLAFLYRGPTTRPRRGAFQPRRSGVLLTRQRQEQGRLGFSMAGCRCHHRHGGEQLLAPASSHHW